MAVLVADDIDEAFVGAPRRDGLGGMSKVGAFEASACRDVVDSDDVQGSLGRRPMSASCEVAPARW